MKDELTPDKLLLVKQWIDCYKKVSDETLTKIRKETGMEVIETTISEHIRNQGKIEGKIEGIRGQIALLESLHKQGVLSKKKMEKMIFPLRQKLNELSEQMPEAA